MKVRKIAGTALGARLTALCWGALTLLAPVAVSACSTSSSSTPPTTFTPSVTNSATTSATTAGSASASAGGTGSPSAPSGTAGAHSASAGGTGPPVTPGATTSPRATQTPEHAVTSTETTTASAPASGAHSNVPTAPPVTGGGGTAGLQDGLLFGVGAAAILAGAGSIAYRRRVTRRR